MLVKVYGSIDAAEVVDPKGEILPYAIKAVPARPGFWREWGLTSPEGKTYRVSESPAGRWECDCKWWVHRGRYRPTEDGRPGGCKHIRGVIDALEDQRTAERVAGRGEGDHGVSPVLPDAGRSGVVRKGAARPRVEASD